MARELTRWGLLALAAAAMALRAPVYLSAPSFWAEEGTLYFAFAWDHALGDALRYRPAAYLVLSANVATAVAARLVRAGLLVLEHAPHVTVLWALAVQLVPIAVIAWSRAPFWNGRLRRAAGVAIVLFGGLSDEIWLNTINSQPWLTVAAALLLLEPATMDRARTWLSSALVGFAGLSAPVACTLVPLFAWRAWRTRTAATATQAVVLVSAAVVQIACVWAAGGDSLERRTAGLGIGVFAATLWARTLVVPLFGTAAAGPVLATLRGDWLGPLAGVLLLVLAVALLVVLARGRDARRLVVAYALVTTFTIATSTGGKSLLLSSPWASSRYFYAPVVLLLLALLGSVRRGAGTVRAGVSALLLAIALAHGVAQYPVVRWKPTWPRWADEVRAWERDPRHALGIWPPPWSLRLTYSVQAIGRRGSGE